MPSAIPTSSPSLPEAQRSRLVRSTRKLESILGETPLPAETIAFPQSVPKYGATSSISPSPTPQASRRSSRPVLTVRLPSLSSIIAAPHSPLHSPLTPSSGISFNSPGPWASAEDLVDNDGGIVRRRKMAAKLSRTLGENIPPELATSSTSGLCGLFYRFLREERYLVEVHAGRVGAWTRGVGIQVFFFVIGTLFRGD
ncbi:hypothetical protein C8R47DRAFT_1207892 [Mycena vitilis]|nr:hypothetical protein C8R47DRAFT_1207892 [Mycena vitilis]